MPQFQLGSKFEYCYLQYYVYNWKTMQLDLMLVFNQTPVEMECYMNIKKGIEVHSYTMWVIKANKNIYGQRQAVSVWNDF